MADEAAAVAEKVAVADAQSTSTAGPPAKFAHLAKTRAPPPLVSAQAQVQALVKKDLGMYFSTMAGGAGGQADLIKFWVDNTVKYFLFPYSTHSITITAVQEHRCIRVAHSARTGVVGHPAQ
ncbi:unnamed protein product [Sphagnum balticum]